MWQDWFFALTGAVYGAVLIPSCLDKGTEIPRWSSVPTTLFVGLSTIVWTTMGMWWAAGTSLMCLGSWAFLAICRPIRRYTEEVQEIPPFEATLEEAQLILAHREWIIEQDRLREGGIEETILQATMGGPPASGKIIGGWPKPSSAARPKPPAKGG